MNKKIIIAVLASLGLVACDKQTIYQGNITTQISYSDKGNTDSEVTTITEYSNGEERILNSNISTSVNQSPAIGSMNNSVIATGKGSVAVVDGKELDMDLSHGINISYNNDELTINGEKPRFKNIEEKIKQNTIDVKLTGKQVRIPIDNIDSLEAFYHVEQKCSDDGKNYLVIDEALKPYLSDKVSSGIIKLKNGVYKIHGKLEFILLTQNINKLNADHIDNITLSCVNKDNFELSTGGVGRIHLKDLNQKSLSIDNKGTTNIDLQGNNIDKLILNNSSTGKIEVNTKVGEARLDNSGTGNIDLDMVLSVQAKNRGTGDIELNNVNSLDAENTGTGDINAKKVEKVIKSRNSGTGSINLN